MGSNSSNMSSGSSVVCGFHGCGRCELGIGAAGFCGERIAEE